MHTTPSIDSEWLRKHHRTEHPRLIWQSGDEDRIRELVAKDEAARAYWVYLINQAEGMLNAPMPERRMVGPRLLQASRVTLKRITTLAFAWRMTGDERYLHALDQILCAVCNFSDWNPPHFLDTAEMGMAVALGLDWVHSALPETTRRLAEEALLKHVIHPSFVEELVAQLPLTSNWNQICNAGVIAAVLAREALEEPFASDAINRMIQWLPAVLQTYAPDGVYPEGVSYWSYGTGYHVLMLSMLESALGTDFGLGAFPGFMESADVMHQLTAPSSQRFNFSDNGSRATFLEPLLWFGWKMGGAHHLQRNAIARLPDLNINPAGSDFRHAAVGMLWFARASGTAFHRDLPRAFCGRETCPVVIFRSSFEDSQALYLGIKGGQASTSHGHMDAGSFILELDGVRWSVDPETEQDYAPVEQELAQQKGDLWDFSQNSQRWTLLTRNNFGHSTISFGSRLHQADGFAALVDFNESQRAATLDLSALFPGQVDRALRTVRVVDEATVEILDVVDGLRISESFCWQMITDAAVESEATGALLTKDGKRLRLRVLTPANPSISIVPLGRDPSPDGPSLYGLKRIEIRLPPIAHRVGEYECRIRLSKG